MTHSQNTPADFCPFSGQKLRGTVNVNEQHWRAEIHVWHFNPWTGTKRDPRDVESDPKGLLIRPPGEVLLAAVPTARDTQVGGDHYRTMDVQPWDVVDTWPREQRVGFYRGNALKYVMRMGTKDEEAGEAGKARHYLDKLIEVLKEPS